MFQKKKRIVDRLLLNQIKLNPCVVCFRTATTEAPNDPCHIKSVGAGGDDVIWNVVPMCRTHHSEQHQIGIISMMRKYEKFGKALRSRGWRLDPYFDTWRLANDVYS